MQKIFFMLSGLLLIGLAPLQAQTLSAKLKNAMSSFDNDSQMQNAISSLCVIRASDGERIFANNVNVGLATASTLKTITSITAFELLEKDFQYTTQVAYSGTIDQNGMLQGNLIIKGSGDPTLGSPRWAATKTESVLANWVSAIKKLGIKSINGDIIGDDSRWSTQSIPDGWVWQDMGNYYGAGASALNWRENQFDIILDPGNVGDKVEMVGTQPKMDYLSFSNELFTGAAGTGDNAYVYLPPYGRHAYLRGTYAVDEGEKKISASVPDPAFECAFRFKDALETSKINVLGKVTTSRRMAMAGKSLPSVTTITKTLSPTLDKIIYWFNKKSINLYGEALLKTIAFESGKKGSTEQGVETLKKFWEEKGIAPESLNIMDGSGLSPGNRVTTQTLCKILRYAKKQAWFPSFDNSLPVLNGMHMKSGSINGVRAYSGYHNGYVFAIIVNNYNGSSSAVRRKMWKVLDVLK